MTSPVTTRVFQESDYHDVLALWQNAPGVEVAEGDDQEGIAQYLRRNPGLSRVAVDGTRIIGAVLCGHDGRRGLIYHLAVAAGWKGRGVGRSLVVECLAGLRAAGLRRVLILIAKDNAGGREFWLDQGFEEIAGGIPFGRDLP